MLKRDYLIKQFEEFGKVLAIMMGLKQDGKWPEFEASLHDTAIRYTGLDLLETEQLSDNRFLEVLVETHKLSDEQLKMLADLLFAKADTYQADPDNERTRNAYHKAFLIYRFILNSATLPYSLDTHYKLGFLKQYFSEAT